MPSTLRVCSEVTWSSSNSRIFAQCQPRALWRYGRGEVKMHGFNKYTQYRVVSARTTLKCQDTQLLKPRDGNAHTRAGTRSFPKHPAHFRFHTLSPFTRSRSRCCHESALSAEGPTPSSPPPSLTPQSHRTVTTQPPPRSQPFTTQPPTQPFPMSREHCQVRPGAHRLVQLG